MKLLRHSANPILLPDPASDWETYNVFNASVIHHNGLFHMHYRAQGLDWISRIGYAVSADGARWNRLRRPVLTPHDMSDARGIEDPRVTEIEGRFYMCYTAYSREVSEGGSTTHAGGSVMPMIAVSDNLITWEALGAIVRDEDNKDHVLFPRRINGHYVALHRRPPQVWLAESDDLVNRTAERMRPIFGPRSDNGWDGKRVGGNGVPIETEHGWLMFYHGVDYQAVYRLGVCLLDLDDPTRVIHRAAEPILEPLELWELRGDVPNVVFSPANVVVGDQVHVYYGGGDHVIGLATARLDELIDLARFG